MINSLVLKSFKSFDNHTFDFNRLNILLGLNSSGKSSVIQAIRMLSNVANGKKGEDVLLDGHGTLEELENNNSEKGSLGIELEYGDGNEDEVVSYPTDGENGGKYDRFPHIFYISADRFGPKDYIPVGYNHEIGQRGENMLNVLQEIKDLHMPEAMRHPGSDKITVEANIEKWLQEISPGVKFTFARPSKTDLSYAHFNDFRSKNVGFGLSYILPVIVALTYAAIKNNSVVIIENPEAHLHPKGQTKIGEFICRAALAGVQVIVETHSDHLFDSVRIFVKNCENRDFCDDVSIYWFYIENDLTKVENPDMLSDGRIKHWPTDMFDQFEINSMQLM